MADEMSQDTRNWYMHLVGLQKTSDEMDEDQLGSADWQDAYDLMVRSARVQTAEIERLRAALIRIATPEAFYVATSSVDPETYARMIYAEAAAEPGVDLENASLETIRRVWERYPLQR